jgi:dihydrofolate reductase
MGGVIEQMSGSPAQIVEQLSASGADNLYIDGGITTQQFLRAGLIDLLVITRVPVLIEEGIPATQNNHPFHGIHSSHKLLIAVGLALKRKQKVESVVCPCEVSVHTYTHKSRDHAFLPMS